MEIIENKENLSSVLTVKISKEDYQPAVDKELKKIRQTAQIKGFRPGNAPAAMIKKMHEPSIRINEVEKLLNDSLSKHIENRPVLGRLIPCLEKDSINWDAGDFEFVYDAGFYSELEYQLDEKTELPYYKIIVEQSDVEKRIEALRKECGKMDFVDEIGDNDSVFAQAEYDNPDYKGETNETENAEENVEEKSEQLETVENEAVEKDSEFESVKAEDVETPEDEENDDDFEDDDFEDEEIGNTDKPKIKKSALFLSSKIPDEYKSLFIGQPLNSQIQIELRKVFPNETDLLSMLSIKKEQLEKIPENVTFTIQTIIRSIPAELNQAFFDRVTEKNDTVHNEEELYEYIKDDIRKLYDERCGDEHLIYDFRLFASDNIKIELSEDFLRKYLVYSELDREENDESSPKSTPEEILAKIGKFVPEFRENMKWDHIIDVLAKRENIEISNDEVIDRLKDRAYELCRQYNNQIEEKDIIEYLVKDTAEINNAARTVKIEKFALKLKEKVKLDIREITFEEYNELEKNEIDQMQKEKEKPLFGMTFRPDEDAENQVIENAENSNELVENTENQTTDGLAEIASEPAETEITNEQKDSE